MQYSDVNKAKLDHQINDNHHSCLADYGLDLKLTGNSMFSGKAAKYLLFLAAS